MTEVKQAISRLKKEQAKIGTVVKALLHLEKYLAAKMAPVAAPAPKPKPRHRISAAGRARIRAAQKARWAKVKAIKGARVAV